GRDCFPVWLSPGLGTIHPARTDQEPLVWCLAIGWCFAARNFRFPRGASDEHTLQRSVRSEQRSGRRKGLRRGGLRRKRPGASLLLGHRALRLCSLVAPCPRPFWAQRNTSQLRDTRLVDDNMGKITHHLRTLHPKFSVLKFSSPDFRGFV